MAKPSTDERVMPHNLEAERAILGSILVDNRAINIALETLSKDDFFSERHRTLFVEMMALSELNRAIDCVTLHEVLGTTGRLERAGGIAYIVSLSDGVPIGTSASITEYARIVKDKSTLRSLINTSNNIISRTLEGQVDADDLLIEAQSQIFEITGASRRTGFQTVKEIVRTRLSSLDALFSAPKDTGAVKTGLTEYDAITQGLHPGELIILAARPSVGKTALAMGIATHAVRVEGRKVAIYSLEMTSQALLQRILCAGGRVDSHTLRTGFTSREETARMLDVYLDLGNLVIDDTSAMTPSRIRAGARRLKAEQGLDLLVVDYLQLISSDRKLDGRYAEVSYYVKAMKDMAKELGIPVLCLSQLSRKGEEKNIRKPRLSDLRDSGAIEETADNTTFIHRTKDATLLIVAKQRNGPVGEVPVNFIKRFTRFENAAPEGIEEEL